MDASTHTKDYQGLDQQAVAARRRQYGKNTLYGGRGRHLFHMLRDVVSEPMFLILVVVCGIYFFLDSIYEGQIMLLAMAMVVATSLYQELRSANAIRGLKKYTQGSIRVMRGGQELQLASEELVPGDIVLLSEGEQVPADAEILRQNDLSVDESIMTGESLAVFKDSGDSLLQGTTIASGQCVARVTQTGGRTALARLGKSMEDIGPEKSLLQQQVSAFVQRMALVGLLAFLLVFGINYAHSHDLVLSLLFGLVMTMSLIPEEIPVAFSSFMAIGAYRMSKIGLLVKQPVTVESLGSASVICLDKTGTITENKMSLAAVYDYAHDRVLTAEELGRHPDHPVLAFAMWASEAAPFDPMEQALHEAYARNAAADARPRYRMVKEYPLEGRPPLMTHVWEEEGRRLIAGKGGVERLLRLSSTSEEQAARIERLTKELAAHGYRILGVARGEWAEADFPGGQDEFHWRFLGLVALYDPPKAGMREVFEQFYSAGIRVKMLTGDYGETALTIARESGLRNDGRSLSGNEVMAMEETALRRAARDVDIFVRMFPEAKLRVVEALKANGDVVAMTGDGVNDGPALKAAHIGVAMGERGTEIAKKAASLVIVDDDLGKMIDAVANGRKIYNNLKKAIRYIISIHIPIILTVLVPLLLGWTYRNIFSPVHVIFLEMIMGPTCSIFFENEPIEHDAMAAGPRDRKEGLFSWMELSGSILQGLVISLGVLGVYFWAMTSGHDEATTRTMTFITLIISNIFLTLVNRSFHETLNRTLRFPNKLLPVMLLASLLLLVALQTIPFVRDTFHLALLMPDEWLVCATVALVCVGWFELYKLIRRPLIRR